MGLVRGKQRTRAMGTSPSNLVGPFDVSAHINPPGEPDEDGTCAPVAWRLSRRAVPGLPLVDAPTSIPNSSSFEADGWMPTPLLRRQSDPLSNRTKFLIASAIVVLLAGYFVFGSSDRSVDVAVAPQPAIDLLSVEFLPLRETEAPSAMARGITVESRAQPPEVQTASLHPTVPLDIKPTESEIEARPPQTLTEREKPLVAASGYDSTCFPSASAVRQNHPGGWPSWTLRAPGHEGTRCWYAATRTTANDHRSEMTQRKETVGITEKLGSPGVLFGVQ